MNAFSPADQTISRRTPLRQGILFGLKSGGFRTSMVVAPSCRTRIFPFVDKVLPDFKCDRWIGRVNRVNLEGFEFCSGGEFVLVCWLASKNIKPVKWMSLSRLESPSSRSRWSFTDQTTDSLRPWCSCKALSRRPPFSSKTGVWSSWSLDFIAGVELLLPMNSFLLKPHGEILFFFLRCS